MQLQMRGDQGRKEGVAWTEGVADTECVAWAGGVACTEGLAVGCSFFSSHADAKGATGGKVQLVDEVGSVKTEETAMGAASALVSYSGMSERRSIA